jgi:dihydroflavonol-4-reductase
MHIFLTGATGFIGQSLTQALLRRGWAVTALVRDPAGRAARALAAQGVSLVPGDVVDTDRSTLQAALRGHDLVFHNAGWFEIGAPASAHARMRAINVQGTDNVLGAALAAGVPRLVYTSSVAALGDTGGVLADETFERRAPPVTYYEATKTEAHALAVRYQQQGAPLVILSPGQVIGPGDHSPFGHFARLYVRGLMPPASWAPNAIYTVGHVDDVAEAMALGAERGRLGCHYIVGGKPITMRAIMAVWRSQPGGLKPRLWLPRPVAWLNGALAEPVLRLLGQPAFFSREVVTSTYISFRFSSALAERELGAHFRDAEQTWRDTLAAERALARQPRRP